MDILYNPSFWVGFCFVLFLVFLVYKKVPGMIGKALDDRAEKIREELDEAKRLREEASSMLADYERKQRDAEKEAQAIIKQAESDAKALAAEMRENLKATIERRAKVAEDKIARAEEQALSEVRASAVNVAIAAAEKIIDKKMTAAASKKLIDDSIKTLKTKLN